MRKVISGNGTDTTATVAAYLQSSKEIRLANLYLIGEADDPAAIWLTDYESPLAWPIWGTFLPGVIKRGTVTTKVGLEVSTLDLTWSPGNVTFTQSVATASPYQLAQLGYYDNWKVRCWTVYMPTPGDANTFGASELFGGFIGNSKVDQGKIVFRLDSFLRVVNEYVPTNVIELLNTAAAYAGPTPPAGFSEIPQFDVIAGGSNNVVIGACTTPSAGHVFDTDAFKQGFLVFNDGPGATLGRVWAAIQHNILITVGGTDYNQFQLYNSLPWPPTPGVDTFYVSAACPINQADGTYVGFPYVPSPESSV